ncbi:hypothetical protein HOLleu_24853 [Holothuria leucospilota]|uniref:Uncharacterized protein n=1 Tax=Holothuria leucospilota TaxID=206669 RepID=A0A9Q1BR96_HOLLE|nr:hypothetical protein HOLleu_24853 [Holothuria leucospilota]
MIQSALTDIINFPDFMVSLKTTKVKPEMKNRQPTQNNKQQETVNLNKSWKEATQDYLDRYYPTDGTFRIPPSLEYEDELKVQKKLLVKDLLLYPNDEVLKKCVAQSITGEDKENVIKGHFEKRRGDNAENEVLTAFEKWGRETGQNMFIFGGYKYSHYLKNVTAEFKSLTSEEGEFDVLIISQQLGVIFVEVKGSVGGKHQTKASGREGNGNQGSGDIDAAMINVPNSEGRNGRQPSEHRSPTKDGHNIKPADAGGEHHYNSDPVDTRGTNLDLKPSNGLSGEDKERDIPSDASKCGVSGKTEIGKYKETTSRSIQSEIQDGWRQLMKGNFVFREMNRDLSFVRRLPYKGFVGLPFLSRSYPIDARICSHHQKHLIFSEELDDLHSWLRDNHFPGGYGKLVMSREEFRELAARFAGLASACTTEIDTIKFTNRKMMCTFLTPEQNAVIKEDREHNVLFGDYGTGKTFVLTRKAASLASPSLKPPPKPGKKPQVSTNVSQIQVVHIIPCADVSNFKSCYGVTFSDQSRDILKFVKPEDKENENIKIYKSFLEFYTTATALSPDPNIELDTGMVIQAVRKSILNVDVKAGPEEDQKNIPNGNFAAREECEKEREMAVDKEQKKKVVHHFFFDEFPVHPLKGGALKSLQKFFSDHLQDSYLWISVATHSLGVSSDKNPSNVLRKELSITYGEDVLLCYLKDVMRVSGEIYKMIKRIEAFIDKGHFEHSNLGHMLRGIKPRLFRLPKRKCEMFGNNPLGCECQVINLASTLRRILDSVVDKDEPLVVTILIYYVMSTPMFRRLHALLTRVAQVLDIELTWNTMLSRYTEEKSTTFNDGLNREVESLSKGIDALETSSTVIDGSEFRQSPKTYRSPCPAKGNEPSEVKKPSTKWKIRVVDQRTFAGCETPVLIFIDPFGMRHWFQRGNGKGSGYHSLIFTRCTGHFILITWSDGEAEKMWNQHLDEYEAEVRDSDATSSFKQGRYELINTGRKATEKCLQMLLDKDLIIDMNVQQTELTSQ